MTSAGRFQAVLFIAAGLAPLLAGAAPLGEATLLPGENIRQESGEVTVPGIGSVTVNRYTWRDSAGDPRSVSLVPASPSTSGYAVQMTYTVVDAGAKRTATINADPAGDGGFGYFVSHELVRTFDVAADQPIANLHGEDDSPLGRYLPSTGSAVSLGTTQATHEYRLNYPHWGTKTAVPDPDPFSTTIPADLSTHQKYDLPVVIRWHFVAGQDYPLWTAEYDLSSAGDRIAVDVRGPYGVVRFNEVVGPDITALRWGDKYRFEADAGAQEFGAKAQAGTLAWTWNASNTGRRYHALGSGAYEFGLVDIVPLAISKYGDGFADRRGSTFGALGGCGGAVGSLPCEYEWTYQSFQYDIGAPARPKFAWGSSPFLGSSLTSVFINPTESIPLSGKGKIRYGLHLVFGRAGAGTPLTLARAAAPLEAAPNLTVAVSPPGGGNVSYTLLGGGAAYTDATRTLAPWDSVSLVQAPASGYTFAGWGGACAGVTSTPCIVTMSQSLSVTANYALNGGTGVTASPASLDFGGQSMNTTAPSLAVTLTNGG
ncbi:MAG TPA: hypothetical protein PK948_10770, partial [Gemmatimonadales bacterium]|nr:hypothetical protein [Gemmatimonadales bacterium]